MWRQGESGFKKLFYEFENVLRGIVPLSLFLELFTSFFLCDTIIGWNDGCSFKVTVAVVTMPWTFLIPNRWINS